MKRICLSLLLSCLLQAATDDKTIDLAVLNEYLNVDQSRSIKQGQKGILYFWAQWCSDCQQKMKGELEDWRKKGIHVFTVNRDKNPSKAKRFLQRHNIKLPVYLDPSKQISEALQVFAVPYWAVIQYRDKKVWTVLKTGSGSLEPAKEIFKKEFASLNLSI